MRRLARDHAEAVRFYDEAFAERDWEYLARAVAPDMRIEDRRAGLRNVLEGSAAHVANHQAVVDIAPDMISTTELLRSDERFTLWRVVYAGSGEYGNDMEVRMVILNEWTRDDDGGLIARWAAVYDDGDRALADAEFERLTSG